MYDLVNYKITGNVAIIELNNSPVNALSVALRSEWEQALDNAFEDTSVEAIVLTGSGSFFCGGADITDFNEGTAFVEPNQRQILQLFYNSDKLTVAAINGMALGGGFENALACHYRIALPSAKVGLPEVHLGLLPGAGGTQILPRLAGAQIATEMIVSGNPVSAGEALKSGIIDRIYADEGDFIRAAVDYARELLAAGKPLPNLQKMTVDTADLPEHFFADFRQSIAPKTHGFFAPEKCIQCVEIACQLPFQEGLKREAELFLECMNTSQARAQQHLFFAEREVKKIPGVDKDTAIRTIAKVAVIGSGTMGGGIAMNFINSGIETTLLDLNEEALTKGLQAIQRNYAISAKKGRITESDVETRMGLLKSTTNYSDLTDADLVIEAVFENMAIKKQVFKTLDEVCKPGAILASNTSTLDINAIAAVTRRPQDVIGLHFFSPANVMQLLEIVRTEKTSPEVIASSLKMAKRTGKIPAVVGVCFGFVGNRMLEPYAREAHRLLLEGATPQQVDGVLTDFGFAIGVFSMYDLAGIDVGYLVRESRREEIAQDPSYEILADKLYALGRYGQKTSRGFYRYEGRVQHSDPELLTLARQIAEELGIERREISEQEILERCVYPLINEGADILKEGIAYRSGDCDIIWVNGYGFPVWRGGPLQYADEIGLDKILTGMNKYRTELGDYGKMWFKPSPLLEELVATGKKFADVSNI